MKVRIKIQPSGLYNGQPWPAVGETITLPDHVAVGMLQSKIVEPVKSGPKQETATPAGKTEQAAPKPTRRNAKKVAADTPAKDEPPAGDDSATGDTSVDATGDAGTAAQTEKE